MKRHSGGHAGNGSRGRYETFGMPSRFARSSSGQSPANSRGAGSVRGSFPGGMRSKGAVLAAKAKLTVTSRPNANDDAANRLATAAVTAVTRVSALIAAEQSRKALIEHRIKLVQQRRDATRASVAVMQRKIKQNESLVVSDEQRRERLSRAIDYLHQVAQGYRRGVPRRERAARVGAAAVNPFAAGSVSAAGGAAAGVAPMLDDVDAACTRLGATLFPDAQPWRPSNWHAPTAAPSLLGAGTAIAHTDGWNNSGGGGESLALSASGPASGIDAPSGSGAPSASRAPIGLLSPPVSDQEREAVQSAVHASLHSAGVGTLSRSRRYMRSAACAPWQWQRSPLMALRAYRFHPHFAMAAPPPQLPAGGNDYMDVDGEDDSALAPSAASTGGPSDDVEVEEGEVQSDSKPEPAPQANLAALHRAALASLDSAAAAEKPASPSSSSCVLTDPVLAGAAWGAAAAGGQVLCDAELLLRPAPVARKGGDAAVAPLHDACSCASAHIGGEIWSLQPAKVAAIAKAFARLIGLEDAAAGGAGASGGAGLAVFLSADARLAAEVGLGGPEDDDEDDVGAEDGAAMEVDVEGDAAEEGEDEGQAGALDDVPTAPATTLTAGQSSSGALGAGAAGLQPAPTHLPPSLAEGGGLSLVEQLRAKLLAGRTPGSVTSGSLTPRPAGPSGEEPLSKPAAATQAAIAAPPPAVASASAPTAKRGPEPSVPVPPSLAALARGRDDSRSAASARPSARPHSPPVAPPPAPPTDARTLLYRGHQFRDPLEAAPAAAGSSGGRRSGSSRGSVSSRDSARSGDESVSGFVFMSSDGTHEECLRRMLFGGGNSQVDWVRRMRPGRTYLFLWNFSRSELWGVFEPTSPGGLDLVRGAWGGRFGAQVRVRYALKMRVPLDRDAFFQIVPRSGGSRFQQDLSPQQTYDLLQALVAVQPLPRAVPSAHGGSPVAAAALSGRLSRASESLSLSPAPSSARMSLLSASPGSDRGLNAGSGASAERAGPRLLHGGSPGSSCTASESPPVGRGAGLPAPVARSDFSAHGGSLTSSGLPHGGPPSAAGAPPPLPTTQPPDRAVLHESPPLPPPLPESFYDSVPPPPPPLPESQEPLPPLPPTPPIPAECCEPGDGDAAGLVGDGSSVVMEEEDGEEEEAPFPNDNSSVVMEDAGEWELGEAEAEAGEAAELGGEEEGELPRPQSVAAPPRLPPPGGDGPEVAFHAEAAAEAATGDGDSTPRSEEAPSPAPEAVPAGALTGMPPSTNLAAIGSGTGELDGEDEDMGALLSGTDPLLWLTEAEEQALMDAEEALAVGAGSGDGGATSNAAAAARHRAVLRALHLTASVREGVGALDLPLQVRMLVTPASGPAGVGARGGSLLDGDDEGDGEAEGDGIDAGADDADAITAALLRQRKGRMGAALSVSPTVFLPAQLLTYVSWAWLRDALRVSPPVPPLPPGADAAAAAERARAIITASKAATERAQRQAGVSFVALLTALAALRLPGRPCFSVSVNTDAAPGAPTATSGAAPGRYLTLPSLPLAEAVPAPSYAAMLTSLGLMPPSVAMTDRAASYVRKRASVAAKLAAAAEKQQRQSQQQTGGAGSQTKAQKVSRTWVAPVKADAPATAAVSAPSAKQGSKKRGREEAPPGASTPAVTIAVGSESAPTAEPPIATGPVVKRRRSLTGDAVAAAPESDGTEPPGSTLTAPSAPAPLVVVSSEALDDGDDGFIQLPAASAPLVVPPRPTKPSVGASDTAEAAGEVPVSEGSAVPESDSESDSSDDESDGDEDAAALDDAVPDSEVAGAAAPSSAASALSAHPRESEEYRERRRQRVLARSQRQLVAQREITTQQQAELAALRQEEAARAPATAPALAAEPSGGARVPAGDPDVAQAVLAATSGPESRYYAGDSDDEGDSGGGQAGNRPLTAATAGTAASAASRDWYSLCGELALCVSPKSTASGALRMRHPVPPSPVVWLQLALALMSSLAHAPASLAAKSARTPNAGADSGVLPTLTAGSIALPPLLRDAPPSGALAEALPAPGTPVYEAHRCALVSGLLGGSPLAWAAAGSFKKLEPYAASIAEGRRWVLRCLAALRGVAGAPPHLLTQLELTMLLADGAASMARRTGCSLLAVSDSAATASSRGQVVALALASAAGKVAGAPGKAGGKASLTAVRGGSAAEAAGKLRSATAAAVQQWEAATSVTGIVPSLASDSGVASVTVQLSVPPPSFGPSTLIGHTGVFLERLQLLIDGPAEAPSNSGTSSSSTTRPVPLLTRLTALRALAASGAPAESLAHATLAAAQGVLESAPAGFPLPLPTGWALVHLCVCLLRAVHDGGHPPVALALLRGWLGLAAAGETHLPLSALLVTMSAPASGNPGSGAAVSLLDRLPLACTCWLVGLHAYLAAHGELPREDGYRVPGTFTLLPLALPSAQKQGTQASAASAIRDALAFCEHASASFGTEAQPLTRACVDTLRLALSSKTTAHSPAYVAATLPQLRDSMAAACGALAAPTAPASSPVSSARPALASPTDGVSLAVAAQRSLECLASLLADGEASRDRRMQVLRLLPALLVDAQAAADREGDGLEDGGAAAVGGPEGDEDDGMGETIGASAPSVSSGAQHSSSSDLFQSLLSAVPHATGGTVDAALLAHPSLFVPPHRTSHALGQLAKTWAARVAPDVLLDCGAAGPHIDGFAAADRLLALPRALLLACCALPSAQHESADSAWSVAFAPVAAPMMTALKGLQSLCAVAELTAAHSAGLVQSVQSPSHRDAAAPTPSSEATRTVARLLPGWVVSHAIAQFAAACLQVQLCLLLRAAGARLPLASSPCHASGTALFQQVLFALMEAQPPSAATCNSSEAYAASIRAVERVMGVAFADITLASARASAYGPSLEAAQAVPAPAPSPESSPMTWGESAFAHRVASWLAGAPRPHCAGDYPAVPRTMGLTQQQRKQQREGTEPVAPSPFATCASAVSSAANLVCAGRCVSLVPCVDPVIADSCAMPAVGGTAMYEPGWAGPDPAVTGAISSLVAATLAALESAAGSAVVAAAGASPGGTLPPSARAALLITRCVDKASAGYTVPAPVIAAQAERALRTFPLPWQRSAPAKLLAQLLSSEREDAGRQGSAVSGRTVTAADQSSSLPKEASVITPGLTFPELPVLGSPALPSAVLLPLAFDDANGLIEAQSPALNAAITSVAREGSGLLRYTLARTVTGAPATRLALLRRSVALAVADATSTRASPLGPIAAAARVACEFPAVPTAAAPMCAVLDVHAACIRAAT